jgi:hypothetical protein
MAESAKPLPVASLAFKNISGSAMKRAGVMDFFNGLLKRSAHIREFIHQPGLPDFRRSHGVANQPGKATGHERHRGLHLPTGFRVHLSFAKFRNATPGVMKASQDVSSQVKSQTFTP